jgi:predicted nucleic acid-binding protein
MSKVVFDTSSAVKILASTARTQAVLMSLTRHSLFTSDYILNEIEYVLSNRFRYTKQKAKARTLKYGKYCSVRNVEGNGADINVRDINDLPILQLCITVEADILVSDDKDLLEVTSVDFKVMKLEEFLSLS